MRALPGRVCTRGARGTACLPVGQLLMVGLLLTVGLPTTVQAQTGTVTGRVTDARTAEPIPGVSVDVVGRSQGTITNSEGRFLLTGVDAGTLTVRATHLAYGDGEQTVTLPAGGSLTVDFALQAEALALDAVVVTGTATGARLRTVGASVARIDAAEAMDLSEAPDFTSLLNARAPGVTIAQNTGRIGASPEIRIRGTSSIGLGNDPLIYIDGVRVNNSSGLSAGPVTLGSQGSSVAGRLNDVNPEDIESIEIIKGPAAATIYGTEASNGVIQIITKRGSLNQAPVFNFQAREGVIFFRDAEDRIATNFMRDENGDIVTWNAVDQEDIYDVGRTRGYFGSVSGGLESLRYYTSVSFDDETGIEPNNYGQQLTLHGNLDIGLGSKFNVATSVNIVDMENHLGTDSGLSATLGAMVGHILLSPSSRGFGLGYPPEISWELYDNFEDVTRFTTSGTLTFTPFDWMRHRLLVGLDHTSSDQRSLERFATPELAAYLSPTQAAGQISQRLRRDNLVTVDYAGSAALDVTPSLLATTSAGVQMAREDLGTSTLGGRGFPAPGVETVSGTAVPFTATQTELVNTTVGFFAQETFGWNDRLFVTGGLRVDNNSAFGEDFKWVTYPKADVSWVISEEPFWPIAEVVDALRLRAAYGESGRAPDAFSALRTFSPVQGPGGSNAVTPGSLGNPNLRPERGKEFELGFEASLFERLTLDFTYFDKTTEDLIVDQDVAPSSGFAGSRPVNVGVVDNSGFEVAATFDALRRTNVAWQIGATYATNDDIIRELGLEPPAISTDGDYNREGFPINAYFSRLVVSADLDPETGQAINVLCDGGPGNAPMDCATAPFVFIGRQTPKHSGAVFSTLQLGQHVRLYALADYRSGHLRYSNDLALRCLGLAGAPLCELNYFPERYDPRIIAQTSIGSFVSGMNAYYYQDASFVKLREVSLTFDAPQEWLRGVSGASLTLSGRELASWTDFEGLDPENSGQAVIPPLSRFIATLNLEF